MSQYIFENDDDDINMFYVLRKYHELTCVELMTNVQYTIIIFYWVTTKSTITSRVLQLCAHTRGHRIFKFITYVANVAIARIS